MFARIAALLVLIAAAVGTAALVLVPRTPLRKPAPVAVAHRASPPVVRTPVSPPTPTPTPYVIRTVIDTGGPIRFGRWFWDEANAPAGPILITVDTNAQVLSVFRGGHEIGTTAVIFGDDGKPTPLGVFPITEKDADHVSNLYGAPMPYMLRLTNDGISIHGSPVEYGYATHGCVGVPVAFARKLFGAVKVGDRVVITHGEQLAVGGAVAAAH